jgi:hypothetical protein
MAATGRSGAGRAAAFAPDDVEQGLLEGPVAFFRLAAEVARTCCDPSRDWDGFVEALWAQLDAGFDLTPDLHGGQVRAPAWFDEPDDPPVVVWQSRGPA